MSVAKEITTGLIVIGLVSIVFLGATQVYLNEIEPSGSGVENTQENSAIQQTASWWDEHDLHAIPGLENASVENLPTAEEIENILFNWPIFENARLSPFIDWNGTYEDVLNILEDYDFEYHFDENNELVIDTPTVFYKKPGEPLPENSYALPYDNNTYRIWNYTEVRNALDFSRHLDNLKVQNGIAIFHMSSLLPVAKVVVPIQEGLAYCTGDNVGRSDWGGTWQVLNPQPGKPNPFRTDNYSLVKIEIHWRLSEGEYVNWLYELENGEPAMTWLNNGELVDWKIE